MKWFCTLALLLSVTVTSGQAQYVPGATLAADMQNLTITLVNGYETQHPRLLFYAADKSALIAKSVAATQAWNLVIMGANGLNTVPSSTDISAGTYYYRIPRVVAGALSWYLTGNQTHKANALAWMKAHCRARLSRTARSMPGANGAGVLSRPWFDSSTS